MALGTLHEDNALPLCEDDLRVERSRHGALYDSFSESEAGSRENSGATGQEYFKRTPSAKLVEPPQSRAPVAGRRWFGLRKAASAGDLATNGGADASRGKSGKGALRKADSAHGHFDTSGTSQRSADVHAVRVAKGRGRSATSIALFDTATSVSERSSSRSAGPRQLKDSARAVASDDASASGRGSEQDASSSFRSTAAAPKGADYYRAQAAAWRDAAALEAAGRPVPHQLVITSGPWLYAAGVPDMAFVMSLRFNPLSKHHSRDVPTSALHKRCLLSEAEPLLSMSASRDLTLFPVPRKGRENWRWTAAAPLRVRAPCISTSPRLPARCRLPALPPPLLQWQTDSTYMAALVLTTSLSATCTSSMQARLPSTGEGPAGALSVCLVHLMLCDAL